MPPGRTRRSNSGGGQTLLIGCWQTAGPRLRHGVTSRPARRLPSRWSAVCSRRTAPLHAHDVLRTVAGRQRGAAAEAVERAAASVLASPEVVAVGSRPVEVVEWEERFTAQQLLALEIRLTAALTDGLHARRGILPTDVVHAVVADRPELGGGSGRGWCGGCAVRATRLRCWWVGPAPGRPRPWPRWPRSIDLRVGRWWEWRRRARAARELEHGAGIASHTIHASPTTWNGSHSPRRRWW